VAVGNLPSVAELIQLLADQREVLLQRGPGAADEVEAGSRRLEQALAALAAASSASGGLPPADAARPSPAELARLQDELQATQATLSRLAAGNRRALETLFGEAPSYTP
jgi:hypothetical protein